MAVIDKVVVFQRTNHVVFDHYHLLGLGSVASYCGSMVGRGELCLYREVPLWMVMARFWASSSCSIAFFSLPSSLCMRATCKLFEIMESLAISVVVASYNAVCCLVMSGSLWIILPSLPPVTVWEGGKNYLFNDFEGGYGCHFADFDGIWAIVLMHAKAGFDLFD